MGGDIDAGGWALAVRAEGVAAGAEQRRGGKSRHMVPTLFLYGWLRLTAYHHDYP